MKLIINLFKLVFYMIKWVFQTIVFVVFVAVCAFVYARYIEPELLIVHQEVITSRTLSVDAKSLKIAQFSDTHLGEDYTIKNLKKTVAKINEQAPDIIIFTGDLIDNNKEYEETEAITRELSALKAKICKVAVYGNHDHGGNGTRRYKMIMEGSGFILLDNSSYIVELEANQKINIMGIDDLLLGRPDIKKTTRNINKDHYNIFISHAPDVADELKAYPIDLQLSGHSHGGQVTIPFIGSPLTPPYAKKYIKGMYTIEGSERMQLYVNTGLGTSQLKYRFFNIPQITVFNLKPQ